MVPVNCPPGLEYLTQVDQLIVKQKVELMEAFTGCETKNKYTIKNTMGQDVYKAKEDTDCCIRMCCGPTRPFGRYSFIFSLPYRCIVVYLYISPIYILQI